MENKSAYINDYKKKHNNEIVKDLILGLIISVDGISIFQEEEELIISIEVDNMGERNFVTWVSMSNIKLKQKIESFYEEYVCNLIDWKSDLYIEELEEKNIFVIAKSEVITY